MESHAPRHILIVDDNRDAADTLALLLASELHNVAVAYDGVTGLTLAHDNVPDVMLIDLGMPMFSGYDVATMVRQNPRFERTVLVAVTGYADDLHVRKALSVGFDLHVSKPIDSYNLRAALHYRRPSVSSGAA